MQNENIQSSTEDKTNSLLNGLTKENIDKILELIYLSNKAKDKYSRKMDLVYLYCYDKELNDNNPNEILYSILGPIFNNNDYFDKTSKNFTSIIVSIKNSLFVKNALNGEDEFPDYNVGEYYLHSLEGISDIINPNITSENRLEYFINSYINAPGFEVTIQTIYITNLASIRIGLTLTDKDGHCILRDLFINVNNENVVDKNNFTVYDTNIKEISYYLSALKVFPVPNKPETGRYFKELIPFITEKLALSEDNLNLYLDNIAYYLDYYFLYDHVYTKKLNKKYDFLDYTTLDMFMFKINKIRQILDESNYEFVILHNEFARNKEINKAEEIIEEGYQCILSSEELLVDLKTNSRNIEYNRIQIFNKEGKHNTNKQVLSIILDFDDKFNDEKDRATLYGGLRKEMELFLIPKEASENFTDKETNQAISLEEAINYTINLPFTEEMDKLASDIREALNKEVLKI